jgi:hypothetical protein
VLLIDAQGTSEIAATVAQTALRRPISRDDGTLNAEVPESFFVFQDALQVHANKLVALSSDPSTPPNAIAREFGALTEACVSCHALYLEPHDENQN